MSTGVISFIWMGVYWIAIIPIPYNKLSKGYITRLLGKVVPPRSWWENPTVAAQYRYALVWAPIITLQFGFHVVSERVAITVGWATVIGFVIDDWFNGDDDLKRKFEGVKNKIKWLMKLPPQPRPY